MEYLIVLVGCIVALVMMYVVFNVNIKKIKKVAHNDKFDKLVSRFPDNEEICKTILKKIGNKKVKIKLNEDSKDKTSLYITITDTILIADINDTYTRIQTIAHECLHSIQNRKMLMFNFVFTNIYFIYFIISIILSFTNVFNNYNIQIIILLLMGFIQYVVRSYLETDAMTKARYLAFEYMSDYIKENNICTKEEIEELVQEYDRINKIGIPAYNYVLLLKAFLKPIIYTIVSFIVTRI